MKHTQKPKVLIIDDSYIILDTISAILSESDFDTRIAEGGEKAFEILEKEQFDIILLDVQMPGINGYQVANVLKKREELKDIPIIFITGERKETSISRAFSCGGVDFISKPFISSELIARVRNHVAQKFMMNELRREIAKRKLAESEIVERNKQVEAINDELIQINEYLDNTSRKLKKSEEKYRLLTENSNDVIWTTDLDLRLTYVSPSVKTIYGFSAEERMQMSLSDIFEDESIEELRQRLQKNLDADENKRIVPQTIELQATHKDGHKIWVELVADFYYDAEGDIIGVQGSTRDITDRKRAEKQLEMYKTQLEKLVEDRSIELVHTEQRLQLLADSIDAFFWLESKGKILYSNSAFGKIWKRNSESIINANDFLLKYTEKSDIQRVNDKYRQLSENKKKFDEQFRIILPSGKIRWIQVRIAPVETLDNDDLFAGIAYDITLQKHYETDLEQARKKAEESDRLKSVFLSNISHEVRTPLNGIIGFSDLLKSTDLSEKQKDKYIELVVDNSMKLLNIMNHIINISKAETGQIKIYKEKHSLFHIMHNLTDHFGGNAQEKGLELIWNKSDEQDYYLMTDADKLEGLLNLFIDNAIKFTSQGRIEFGYIQKTESVDFFVKDTGIGIAIENHKLIFERFRQIEETMSRNYGGNGLGLAIANAYAKALDGEITLDSELGKGSTFYFRHPL